MSWLYSDVAVVECWSCKGHPVRNYGKETLMAPSNNRSTTLADQR